MPDAALDPSLLTVLFVAGAALLAGWVDAVVHRLSEIYDIVHGWRQSS